MGAAHLHISPSSRDVTSSTTSTTFNINYTTGTNLSSNHIIDLIVASTSTILGSRTGAGTITVNSSTTGWPSSGNYYKFLWDGQDFLQVLEEIILNIRTLVH